MTAKPRARTTFEERAAAMRARNSPTPKAITKAEPVNIEGWRDGECVALARQNCAVCHGSGRTGKIVSPQVCNCVLRAVFRICWHKWSELSTADRSLSRVQMENVLQRGNRRRPTYGRKWEEYIADFELLCRRTLADNPPELMIFDLHFIRGIEWHKAVPRLRGEGFAMDRGQFFHVVYRIMSKLGGVLRTTQPYGLYPVDEYFSAVRISVPRSAAQEAGKYVGPRFFSEWVNRPTFRVAESSGLGTIVYGKEKS